MVAAAMIKKGYKPTEVGVIPDDWDVWEFGQIVDYTKGFAFKSKDYCSDGIRIIRVSDTTYDAIKETGAIYVGESETKKYKKWRLTEDDLIFSTVGSKPPMYDSLVGKAIIVTKKYEGCLLNQNAVLIRAKHKPKHVQLILLGHFRTKRYIQYIESIYRGNANQASITLADLFKFLIPLPRLDLEQAAIAAVLSDTDTLIERLEKLIAKKKAIKQGAMQQLLAGKKRLPGFSGEWAVKQLGEIGKAYGGLSGKTKSDFDEGKYPYIPFMNIMSNPVIDLKYLDYVNIRSDEKQNKAIKGDLFFNGSSETPEEVGMCSVLQGDIPNLYLNSFCFGFRLNDVLKTDGLYLSYFFRSPVGRQLVFSLAQGATRYNLSKTNFMNLEIPYPDPAEQSAIAAILSDMDAEIYRFEQKKAKYTMLKQGMMQQLLTGKIRVYDNN